MVVREEKPNTLNIFFSATGAQNYILFDFFTFILKIFYINSSSFWTFNFFKFFSLIYTTQFYFSKHIFIKDYFFTLSYFLLKKIRYATYSNFFLPLLIYTLILINIKLLSQGDYVKNNKYHLSFLRPVKKICP